MTATYACHGMSLPQMLRSSVDVTPINSQAEVGFATRELRVTLQRNTGKITFANSGGDIISEDYAPRPASFHGSSFKVYKVYKAMPPNEHYFGLGDKPGPQCRYSYYPEARVRAIPSQTFPM